MPKDGRVVKASTFGLARYSNPVDIAKRYNDEGADRLFGHHCLSDNRDIFCRTLLGQSLLQFLFRDGRRRCAYGCRYRRLYAGADKASINTAAVTNPDW